MGKAKVSFRYHTSTLNVPMGHCVIPLDQTLETPRNEAEALPSFSGGWSTSLVNNGTGKRARFRASCVE